MRSLLKITIAIIVLLATILAVRFLMEIVGMTGLFCALGGLGEAFDNPSAEHVHRDCAAEQIAALKFWNPVFVLTVATSLGIVATIINTVTSISWFAKNILAVSAASLLTTGITLALGVGTAEASAVGVGTAIVGALASNNN